MLKNKYNITKEEIESIKTYINKDYISINSMLETGLDNEIRIENNKEGYTFLTEKSVKVYIEKIKEIYSAILKYSSHDKNEISPVYRAITLEELNKIKSSKKSNRICSVTPFFEIAKEKYSNKWNQKIILKISVAPDVPYIKVNNILDTKNKEDIILISPFININKIEHSKESKEVYDITVSKSILEKEPSRAEKVYKETEEANEYLKEYFAERKEIEKLYSEKDELLNKILNDANLKGTEEKKNILEQVKILEKNIEEKTNKANILEVKYSSWKRELGFLIKMSLKEVELELEKKFKEEEQKKEEQKEKQKEESEQQKELEEHSIQIKLKEQIINENIKIINKINRIKINLNSLDKNQRKYEDFAKKLLVKYEKQTDIIEVKENLYDIENSINKFNKKIEKIELSKENEIVLKSELEVSKFCNNSIEKIQKEHEITNLNKEELIEFRTGIYDKVIRLKGKLDLKDLTVKKSKIENKISLVKVIDKIIGKDKKNKVMLETIDMKIAAINSSLKSIKNKDKRSVSVHKMIIEIDEAIIKNFKNKALKKEVADLEKLRVALTNIFNIDEEKVKNEIQKKEISNLPVTKKGIKISYEELENWKANEWIKKNKYLYYESKNVSVEKNIFLVDIKALKKEIALKIKNK